MSLDPLFAVGWIILLVAMAVLEVVALWRNRDGTRGRTLSELSWWIIRRSWALRIATVLFLGWLTVHIVSLGRWP